MRVKIYGYGYVGKAVKKLFPEAGLHDPYQHMYATDHSTFAFVCVPTPPKDGALDCSIVEHIVKECDSDIIIIRSTVNVGTCDELASKYDKHIVFQPEYLGETINHPMNNGQDFIVFGGDKDDICRVIELYHSAINANVNIIQLSRKEAELVKLTENRAIAFKVAQCQELYDACEAANIDYYTIRDVVFGNDPRFNLWWTFVYPDKRGFNSKCIPKDVYAWRKWAESVGADTTVMDAILFRNEELIKWSQNS